MPTVRNTSRGESRDNRRRVEQSVQLPDGRLLGSTPIRKARVRRWNSRRPRPLRRCAALTRG